MTPYNYVTGKWNPNPQFLAYLILPGFARCGVGAGGKGLEELIEFSTTDAAVFLTVYPTEGLYNISDDDYTVLGNQLLNCEPPPARIH